MREDCNSSIMDSMKKVGEVVKFPCEIKQFEWRISDFFTFIEGQNYMPMESPTFSVADTSWNLQLYLNWNHTYPFTELVLSNNMKREYLVEFNFGLKNCDGSIEQLLSGILKEHQMRNEKTNFIMRSELVRRKSELVAGDVLTITCTVKLMTQMTHSAEQTALDPTRRLMLIRLDKLSDNFKDLFTDKETCDVTLKVKDKEYKAHKSVLIARCSVFAATFKHDTLERQTGVITITDCDSDSFAVFLEYLYCGKLVEFSVCNALHLYYTSDKYHVQELKAFCVEYLMQHLAVENICEVVVLADKYDEKELLSAVQEFFNKHVRKILRSPEWECLLKKDYRLANKLMIEMSDVKLKD